MAAVIVLFLAMAKVKTNHRGTENVKNKNDWAGEEMIANNSSILEIQKQAIQIGFQSLRYDGIKKVLQGLTTMDEVNRITGEGMDLSY